MGEALRDIELASVLEREGHPDPFTESGRSLADIHHDVEYFAAENASELPLGTRQLIVKSTQHALLGVGYVVLHELRWQSCRGEASHVEAFEEEAPVVAEPARLEDQHARQFSRQDVHSTVDPI